VLGFLVLRILRGVQLLYRFILFYGHSIISFPLHSTRVFIGLGGVQGHPGDPTPWVAALGESPEGSSPLTGNLMKMYGNVKPYKPL